MILFLDFDGVLHPSVQGEGQLFMWTGLLVEALADYSDVQIVLSTSWVRRLHYIPVRGYLPPSLRNRVIGSTWHHIRNVPSYNQGLQLSYWQDASRYRQIRHWVDYYRVRDWLAIDDDTRGWEKTDRAHLIQTNGATGLSDPAVLAQLQDCLRGGI